MTRNLTIARQMVWADLLRLRKKRGFIALVVAVVLVPLVIATGYNVIQHASDPAAHGPAGGLHYFVRVLDLLGIFMGPVAAILIGAEAGAGDLAAGVFRDNVLTGRSRTALFLARIPAALVVCLSVTALGFVTGLAATFGFAGGLPTPSASLILESAGWLALANSVVCVIAIGLASLTGSRPGTITALIGWQLVLSPLLVQSTNLGSLRNGLLDGVMLFLKPGPASGAPTITMSVAVAMLVLGAWLMALPVLGAWRTRTRDA
jgi:ABC-type transport system involved in multi-copper enzyme maturation permease subunit